MTERPENLSTLNIDASHLDADISFRLINECDVHGDPIEGATYWLGLHDESGSIEGKYFTPPPGNIDSLAVFTPGLPGDSVVWMEKKYVPALLENGKAVFILRHRGTKTDSQRASDLLYCSERTERGSKLHRTIIGGDKEFPLNEMGKDPSIVLNTLGNGFSHIDLIGHSAGALMNAYSVQHVHPDILQKIRTYLSLSGFTGHFEDVQPGVDLESYFGHIRQFIAMGDPKRNVAMMSDMLDSIQEKGIPDHIMTTLVLSPGDEFFTLANADTFQSSLGRGLRIIDKTQEKKDGEDIHDLHNMRPETLIRLLAIHRPAQKRSLVASNTLSKTERVEKK